MWYPKNSFYSTENFNDHSTGNFWFQNFSGQNHIGGVVSLRNIATGDAVIISPGEPWPSLGWDRTNEFSYSWASISGQYITSGGTVIQNGIYPSISLTGNTTVAQLNRSQFPLTAQYFGRNLNFETGVVIQSSVMISRLTGVPTNGNNTYGFMIRSGAYWDIIRVQAFPQPGFVIGTGEYETYIPASGILNSLTSFRLGIKGNPPNSTGHFITQEGYHAIITGFGRYSSTRKMDDDGIIFGNLSTYIGGVQQDPTSRIEFGKLYQKHGLLDIGGDFISDTEYSKTSITMKTGPFKPIMPISKWERAYVNLVGTTGGTISVIPEVRNSSNTNWRPLLTSVPSTGIVRTRGQTGGLFWLDISTGNSVYPAKDGTDEIRFEINQSSADGSMAPLGVDYITVVFSKQEKDGLTYLDPEVGSSDGEYPVLVGISPNYRGHFGPTKDPDPSTIVLLPLDSEGETKVYPGDIVRFAQYEAIKGSPSLWSSENETYQTPVVTQIPGYLASGVLGGQAKNFKNTVYVYSQLNDIFLTGNGTPTIYNTNQGQLLASNNYSITYPSSTGGGVFNATSAPTINGSYLSIYANSARTGTSSQANRYFVDSLLYSNASGSMLSYIAQGYEGLDGYGFETPEINLGSNTGQYVVLESVIQVDKGCLGIYMTGNNVARHVIAKNAISYNSTRYGNTQRVRTILPTGASRIKLQFFGVNENSIDNTDTECRFRVADLRIMNHYNSPITYTGHMTDAGNIYFTGMGTSPNISMDIWAKTDGLRFVDKFTGNIFSLVWPDTHGMHLGLSRDGYPVFRYYQEELTGCHGVDTNWHHYLIQYKNPTRRMELYMDGELVGLKHSSPMDYPNGVIRSDIGNGYIGAVQQARIRLTNRTAPQVQTLDAMAAPLKFVSQYQLQTGTGTIVLYRFDKGTMIDFSTGQYHAYSPDLSGQYFWTERDPEGIFGEAVGFVGAKGGAQSCHKIATEPNRLSFAGYLANVKTDGDPRIFKWGDYGLKIENGKLVFNVADSFVTGSTSVDSTFAWSWYLIHFENGASNTSRVTGWYGTGIGFYNPIQDFTNTQMRTVTTINDIMYFGHDPNVLTDYGDIYLDEFGVFSGHISTGIMPYNKFKATPDEYIYMNRQVVATGRVSHLGVYDKQFIIPGRSDYSETGAFAPISVNTNIGIISVTPMFSYLGTRKLIPDPESKKSFEDFTNKLCKTKSPFRIGVNAPSNSINLAYITADPFVPDNSLSLIQAPDQLSDNYVNSLKDYKVLSPILSGNAISTSTVVTYTGQITTDDIVLTNYTMIRDGQTFAAPLFYRHILGDSRYYLLYDGGTNNADTDFTAIRNSIKIVDHNGLAISIEQFPWDIRVSKYRKDGELLPRNVYTVEILSRDRFIPNATLFCEYNAASPANNYRPIRSYREVLNPEPIFQHLSSDNIEESFITIDQGQMATLAGSTIDRRYNPGPLLKVNHITGDYWSPWIHRDTIFEDDFLA